MRKLLLTTCAAVAIVANAGPARAASLPPSPAPSATFEVGMLHVERYGSGPAVILIPGLACGAWTWNGVIPQLAATHTVFAVTLAGFAGRAPIAGESTFARFDLALGTLVSSQHLTRPALVGHSLGGTLAIAYAEAHPGEVGAVVAVDGLPVFPTVAALTPERRAAAAEQFANAVRAQSDADFSAFEQQYMATVGASDEGVAKQLAALSARSDRSTVAAWLQADLATDLRPQLGKITAPLTEITGWSPAEPYPEEQKTAFYRSLFAGAANVNVVTLSGAKHFVMFDQPERFQAALAGALDRSR